MLKKKIIIVIEPSGDSQKCYVSIINNLLGSQKRHVINECEIQGPFGNRLNYSEHLLMIEGIRNQLIEILERPDLLKRDIIYTICHENINMTDIFINVAKFSATHDYIFIVHEDTKFNSVEIPSQIQQHGYDIIKFNCHGGTVNLISREYRESVKIHLKFNPRSGQLEQSPTNEMIEYDVSEW